MSGRIIVISAPSGAGKTTVVKELLKRMPLMKLSVSCTTRPPRPGEVDHHDYHFISNEQFEKMIKGNEFVEWANVHGAKYGTPKSELDNAIKSGIDLILDIDVQGGQNIKSLYKEAIMIFILPPSVDVLKERLEKRGTNEGADLERRIANASRELEAKHHYDYKVVNDDLELTLIEVTNILEKTEY